MTAKGKHIPIRFLQRVAESDEVYRLNIRLAQNLANKGSITGGQLENIRSWNMRSAFRRYEHTLRQQAR